MGVPISHDEGLSSLQTHYVSDWLSSHQAEIPSSLPGRDTQFVAFIHKSPPYYQYQPYLQTQEYQIPMQEEKVMRGWHSVAESFPLLGLPPKRILEKMNEARLQLEEIRQEAMEASVSDRQIDPVSESAYNDAYSLLELAFQYNVPIPDISWAEDGSLGFEWRPANGIVTMGVYGDNLVIYGAFFNERRKFEGICSMSDTALLQGLIVTLSNLLV